jgi:NAD(P)-dependent dehydrogenase (short-subunit alcohol dehydrogenase family)
VIEPPTTSSPSLRAIALSAAYADTPPEVQREATACPARLTGADRRLLENAVVVITGGAGAIGSATATALSAVGSRVVIADSDYEAAAALEKKLRKAGGNASAWSVDVTSPETVRRFAEEIGEEFDRIDVVINGAGIMKADPFLEMRFEDWQRVFRVNVDGTFLVTQAIARVMVKQEHHPSLDRAGLILCVSSLAAAMGRPIVAAYGASKAAIDHLAKTSSVTLGPSGISTLVVYPPTVKAGMWSGEVARMAEIEGVSVEDLEAQRRFESADDIAGVIVDAIAKPGLQLNGHLVLWTRDVGPLP